MLEFKTPTAPWARLKSSQGSNSENELPVCLVSLKSSILLKLAKFAQSSIGINIPNLPLGSFHCVFYSSHYLNLQTSLNMVTPLCTTRSSAWNLQTHLVTVQQCGFPPGGPMNTQWSAHHLLCLNVTKWGLN